MPAHPQKPKLFVPTDLAKAHELAKSVGRGQCGRNGRQGNDKKIERRIARRQTSVRLHDFVCKGTLDCTCAGCGFELPTVLKSGMYPIVACGGSHTNANAFDATLRSWLGRSQALEALHGKIAGLFPDAFHVREAIRRAVKKIVEERGETFE